MTVQNNTPKLLVSEREMAAMLSVTPRHLFTLRQQEGMPHHRLGARVLYDPAEVQAWLRDRRQTAETRGMEGHGDEG